MADRFAKFVITYRLPLLIMIIAASVPLIWLARTTRLSHKAGYIFPWGHPNVDLHIKMSTVFGGSNLVAIVLRTKKADIFHAETLEKIYRIQKAVELMDGIVKYNIYSIASRKLKHITTGIDDDGTMMLGTRNYEELLQEIFAGSQQTLATYRKAILNDDDVYGTLVARDCRGAVVLANFKYEEHYQYIFEHLQKVIAAERDADTELHLIGRPIMLGYIHRYMSQILYIFGLALLVMVLLLYGDFRRKRAVFLPLTAGLLAVIWGMGILNLFGFDMDVLSITVPFLVLALSQGHSVQIMQRYYEEARVYGDPRKASQQVLATLVVPASTAILTDGIGFFSLALLPFPIIQTMAIVAAAGILAIWITNFIMIPIILSYLELPSLQELERKGKTGLLLRLLESIIRLTTARPQRAAILIAAACILALGSYTATRLRVGEQQPGSPDFKQNAEYNRGDHVLNEHFAGTNLLWIYVAGESQKDLLKPEMISYLNNLQRHLEDRPEVNYTLSYVDALKKVNSALHNNDPRWEVLPGDQIAAWECLELIMGEPEERRDWSELDLRQANIRAFVSDHMGETIRGLMQDVRPYALQQQPEGVQVEMAAGLIGIYEAILDEISRSQISNIIFMFASVLLCTALAYRSLGAGLLVFVPLILGNIITFAVMALANVGLFIYTLPVSALGIGVGVDYSLYILSRLQSELPAAHSFQDALFATLRTSGRAVIYTALTITCGVVLLCISEMRFQAILGVMLGVIMIANMLSALLVLPALLSIIKPGFLFKH